MGGEDRVIMCKRDGKPMYFVAESEKMSDGSTKITYYYKCPICGYKIEVEQVIIKSEKDSIVMRRFLRPVSS